jgi:hypothetical protein
VFGPLASVGRATLFGSAVALVAFATVAGAADPADLISAPPLIAPSGPAAAEELPLGSPAVAPEADRTIPPQSLGPGQAAPEGVEPRNHPWGSFDVGAWRQSKITSESFDAAGALVGRSVTARTERLVRKSPGTVTLGYETVVEVSGKRLPGPRQEVTIDLWTDEAMEEGAHAAPRGERLADAVVSLRKRPIECQVWAFSTPLDRGERLHTVWYAPGEQPSILRREQADQIEGTAASRERQSVTRRRIAMPLAGGVVEAYFVATDRELAGGGRIESYGAHAAAVPGGLLTEGVTELDAAGQRVRWTTTELVTWGATAADRQGGGAASPPGVAEGMEPPNDAPAGALPATRRDGRPRRFLRLLQRGEMLLESQGLLDTQGLIPPIEGGESAPNSPPPAPTTEAPPFDPAAEGGEPR